MVLKALQTIEIFKNLSVDGEPNENLGALAPETTDSTITCFRVYHSVISVFAICCPYVIPVKANFVRNY